MSKPRPKMRPKKSVCEGKKRYDTLEAAEKAAYRPRVKGRYGTGDFMFAYACRICKGYHYGHRSLPR